MARRKKKQLNIYETIIFLIILFIIAVFKYFDSNTVPLNNLEVQFIDVGQADSILIRTSKENILIDAGNNVDGPLLVEYLKSIGIKDFSLVFGTHAHEDHIGGMDDIINSFKIDSFYMPDVITTTKTFEDVLDSLENNGYYFDTPAIGEKFNIDDATLEVIYVGDDENNLNNSSIVLRLDHGNNSFLFMADATTSVENDILHKNIKADVLKVGHHGSKTSTSQKFLNKVKPKYAIIEVGENNMYNHPHDKVINRLKKKNINIYETRKYGTIIMNSDGIKLDISTVKTKTDGVDD